MFGTGDLVQATGASERSRRLKTMQRRRSADHREDRGHPDPSPMRHFVSAAEFALTTIGPVVQIGAMTIGASMLDGLPAGDVRPRLRDDVQFVPFPGGTFVVMPTRNDMGFRIAGRDTCSWLRRLAPFLTGDHSLSDLGRRLQGARRERMLSLIARLQAEGAVRNAAVDSAHTLSSDVRRAYASVIAFIAREAESPERRFQLYRDSHPIVVGSGRLMPPLIHSLLATGVDRVRAIVTAEQATDLDRLCRILAVTLGAGAEGRLEIDARRATGPWFDLSGPATAGVLHVSERPMPERAGALARACGQRNLLFGQATVVGDRGLVGPVGDADRLPVGWEVELWRLAGGDADLPVQDLPSGPVSAHLGGPTAAMISNHLCAAFLKQVTGLAAGTENEVIGLDLETLQVGSGPAVAVTA